MYKRQFLEIYGNNEADHWGAYSAFRLESGLSNNGVSPTAKDYSITKAALRDFIKTQRDLGMNVVPEIDMPAHAVAFTLSLIHICHGVRRRDERL